MAGSFSHVAKIHDGKLAFRFDLIENLRDAYEACEEMFDMIEHLSGGDRAKLHDAHRAHCLKRYGHFDEKLWPEHKYLMPEREEDSRD